MTSRTRRTGYQERPSSWSEMADSAKQNRDLGVWIEKVMCYGLGTVVGLELIVITAWYFGWTI